MAARINKTGSKQNKTHLLNISTKFNGLSRTVNVAVVSISKVQSGEINRKYQTRILGSREFFPPLHATLVLVLGLCT